MEYFKYLLVKRETILLQLRICVLKFEPCDEHNHFYCKIGNLSVHLIGQNLMIFFELTGNIVTWVDAKVLKRGYSDFVGLNINVLWIMNGNYYTWIQQISLFIYFIFHCFDHVLTSNSVSKYPKCFSSIQTTCKDDADLGHQKVLDKDACMALCNLNFNCNFIFLTDSNICITYQSCDEMQRTESVGSTFAKSSCPGNYLNLDN